MPCAVILTAHPTDYQAIRAHLTNVEEETHSQGTIYELGQFSAPDQTWEVAIVEVATGNSDSAAETERAIAHWQPNVVLSVGVAAGLKDVTTGSVVAAIEVYDYEVGKVTESGFSSRPKLGLASYKLEQRAKAEARKEDWLERIQGETPNWTPQAIVGAIAAGEKEITTNQAEIYRFLRSNYEDALAVDDSGYGVLKAVRANAETNALIIRGITHVIDQDVTVDLGRARIVAARHASAFAFEILSKLEAAASFRLSQAQRIKLKQDLANASRGLLSWKSTLSNNQPINRPELDELLNRIKIADSSTTIVLGVPGSGKSALMATLGNKLLTQGYSVLAIKADQLNGAINTIDDLQRDLHLDLHPSDAIYAISSKEPIIILIDQLDAISELLDRKSERLNLLLSLIQRLSGSKNIYIVATCREFEFRYGSQFARLAEIDQLDLHLPAWEKIAPILEAAGHQPANMGESLRELLQNPLHLDIFLDVAQPGDVFTSSQTLLDQLWKKRVWEEQAKNQLDSKRCIDFLEKLANRMTDDEVLWVPSAIADSSPQICQALKQAGLLIDNPENSTIGFRHQTYYDYTLARAFARGSQSLTNLVLERQNGIFIRPILLRSLNYLRGVSSKQYEMEIRNLLANAEINNWKIKNRTAKLALHLLTRLPCRLREKAFKVLQIFHLIHIRTHIYALLIEFIGSQQHPNPVEVQFFISLLKPETEGPKILAAVVGSSGWFKHLKDRPEFTQWMEKPAEQAVYCSPILAAAVRFAAEDVWGLLEEYWLDEKSYDFISVRVIYSINQWTPKRVWLTQQVIQRSEIDWHTVAAIAERIAETLPNYGARIIRAFLDQRLAKAIMEGNQPKPKLSKDADEVAQYFYKSKYDPLKPIEGLIHGASSSEFYEIESFAEEYFQDFLREIWGWFIEIAGKILRNELNEILNVNSYQGDGFSLELGRGKILDALLVAITKFASQDPTCFLKFVQQNQDSDLMAVHRFLARGLEQMASQRPQIILRYLLANTKRFCIGDKYDQHGGTKKLIAAIVPHLSFEDTALLEAAIRKFDYRLPESDVSAEIRFRRLQSNRQHRLRLLKAIPDKYLSTEAKFFKQQEERTFPNLLDRDSHYPTIANIVGPPMTQAEMAHASDKNVLNLFDELADLTEAECLFRKSSDNLARAGSLVEQSREFGRLVKENPDRFLGLLPQFQPQRHEAYVGKALVSLSEIDFPADQLLQLIEELDRRGFSSEDFYDNAAQALEKVAERNQGLPSFVLILLERWLPTQTRPDSEHYWTEEDHYSDLKAPILFGSGGSHILSSGRASIVRAIAEGYLKQNPPDLEGWARFIRSQLGVEPHPAVWVDIVTRMPPLLNGDRIQATELFDQVIRNCPEVLQYAWALYFISRTIGWFEPKETVQGWIEMLRANSSNFSQQTYGELLLIQYLQHQDEWSVNRIYEHLSSQESEAVLCGLAHAASHLWVQQRCRAIAAEILYTLAASSAASVQHAVASVFRCSRDHFRLDKGMRKIIQAVCKNQDVLVEAAYDLIEIIETEELVENDPEVAVEVCKSLLGIGSELADSSQATALVAESLTTIAIKLHRQASHREIGLQIFEKLLALNLMEARSALETLDRKPNRSSLYIAPRRRLRGRRARKI